MQTELEKLHGLDGVYRRRRPAWQRGKDLPPFITWPIEALNRLPIMTAGARQEAASLSVTRNVVEIPHLPSSFEGMTVAFLTDFHCGPLTSQTFLERAVMETNRLKPDVTLLGGDYVTRGTAYIGPIVEVLRKLAAPLGSFGVLGNHDYWDDPHAMRLALKEAGIVDLTNSGRWISVDGSRIRVAGVGDLWEDRQDLSGALSGAGEDDAVILLSHNPDYVMGLAEPRVKLVLSGHTHGGQICLPRVGPLLTNSKYGKRLVSGLVSFESFSLYTSRGLGTVLVPIRYNCPPEIALITLRRRK